LLATIKRGPSDGGRAVAAVAMTLLLLACTTPAERQAAKNARVERQAAKEINRICALPEAEREAELKKIKNQSGMVLYCGSR
jgi:hypothetical protein